MVNELHHIDRCHKTRSCHYGVILRTGFRVDEQQTVCAQSEAGESGEEGQVHFSYLVLAGDELCSRLTGYGR